MTKRQFTGESSSIETDASGVKKEIAGMDLSRLLKEMARLKKKMLETGEDTEQITEPTTEREIRLREIYAALEDHGVEISSAGELEPEKIEMTAVREQVEEFLANVGSGEQPEDDSE